ncbi:MULTISPECIES: ABATE domain-containing protein [unclassified Rhizobium]|uniref:CGNR zinc finger domain-containing protein n=1 Tax=unclassified Rhizobium TaxID=2613769 RepID=UPI001FD949FE|nr:MULTISPECIES: ABATE domain-containing protein [unclassified Rhizobium]MDK4735216.1 CGNR zinc finger domain-containing protein [Rhizobium sp. CNPSo 3490]
MFRTMASSIFDMRLSGGHPALELVNTLDSRRGRWGPDFLRSFDDVLAFVERLQLIDARGLASLRERAAVDPGKAEDALANLIRLRETIYTLFIAEDTDAPYPEPALSTVVEMARAGRARQTLLKSNQNFVWALPFDDLSDIFHLFAIAATDLLTNRSGRRRVRECKGDNCGWLFLDRSKGGRRRWCSEASCGVHSRVKRFRAHGDDR